jgi:glycosyltransferase involved in cell wall biosynthesis
MKSIAIISDHASPLADLGGVDSGGQNVYVNQVASHLAALGYSVDVFTRRDDPKSPDVIECGNGVRVVHVTAGPREYVPKERLLPYMDAFTGGMIKNCSQKRYDVMHANFWMSGLVALNLKRVLGIPFVITFHALGRIRRLYQNAADTFPDERFSIEDRIVRECDGIIAECPQDRADLVDFYRADTGKIAIIPCGFDPREVYPIDKAIARRFIGFRPGTPLVLQLGRIVPRKGIDTVIRAFSRFVKAGQHKATLAVVGGAAREPDPGHDPEIRRLLAVATEEKIAGHVVFTGRAARDDIKYYFSAADVFVTTPWYEPFGITPVESMACGTPVIGASVGGIKYTVKDSVTGRLVPANNPEAVAKALLELTTSAGLCAEMGRNAIERVNRMFTWEIVVQKLVRFYKKTAGRRPGAYATELAFAGTEPVSPAASIGEQEENNICNR